MTTSMEQIHLKDNFSPQPVAEPPFVLPGGLAAAAGVAVAEDDGRMRPTNRFGG
jgi:hypothetical protein